MKIKPPSRRNRKIAELKRRYIHYWLAPQKQKKAGRSSQLNKFNRRLRVKSEFVLMAEKIEQEPINLFNRR